MFALSLIAAGLTAASTVTAFPAANLARDAAVGPWCDGLGAGAFDDVSHVTLAALNTTLPNANSTGTPLVLATGGAFAGIEIRRFGTWASFGANDYPSFSLVNGTIVLNDGPKPARAVQVQDASELSFVTSTNGSPINPLDGAQIYCGVANPDPTGYATLAVNGDADSFSICRETYQQVVIYKAAADRNEACYPVKLQIIPSN
ncbi:hypothetical protein BV20DRAFT_974203 [Pilatotrama ljubarskyi]|nr:hypothetical protein BV20DRAFT_974203 [Pilatotrama ljubarskyi]